VDRIFLRAKKSSSILGDSEILELVQQVQQT
jgi:hypothetical protein